MKVLVKELYRNTEKFADAQVTVSGWIRNIRASKNFGVYFTAGYECFMAHSLVRNTGYSATFTSQLYSNITFNLGVNF